MNNRLAKFEDLVPSTLPFVEGKLEGCLLYTSDAADE